MSQSVWYLWVAPTRSFAVSTKLKVRFGGNVIRWIVVYMVDSAPGVCVKELIKKLLVRCALLEDQSFTWLWPSLKSI
jgi:hypothetical protein